MLLNSRHSFHNASLRPGRDEDDLRASRSRALRTPHPPCPPGCAVAAHHRRHQSHARPAGPVYEKNARSMTHRTSAKPRNSRMEPPPTCVLHGAQEFQPQTTDHGLRRQHPSRVLLGLRTAIVLTPTEEIVSAPAKRKRVGREVHPAARLRRHHLDKM